MNHQNVRLAAGLYFVATPIGTARDITLRALDILASADVLAAEDTRSLRRLMEIHGVPLSGRKIIAYHDYSTPKARETLVQMVRDGKSLAYASEAGMPLIADPGFALSRAMVEAGQPVTTAPGASAVLTALSLGGLPTDAFFFGGFLPNTRAARRARLQSLASVPGTLVFYESPKRIGAALKDMADMLGAERSAALCRELTKKFEEVQRASLADLCARVEEKPPKGEIVMLVDRGDLTNISESDLESDLETALADHSVKDAAEIVARMYGQPRRKIYQMALKLGKD